MTPEGKAKLRAAGDECSHYLERIAKLFTPKAKITLLVRDPEFPDGSRSFMLTDDTFPEVTEALRIAETQKDETQ